LVSDEFVEVGVGEHLARAALAVADGDIFERAGSDVTVQRLDRAMQFAGGLGGGAETIRQQGGRLRFLSALGSAEQGFDPSLYEQFLEPAAQAVAPLVRNEDARRLAR
jgi:hypothetical protein